jgi:hypothetical protein
MHRVASAATIDTLLLRLNAMVRDLPTVDDRTVNRQGSDLLTQTCCRWATSPTVGVKPSGSTATSTRSLCWGCARSPATSKATNRSTLTARNLAVDRGLHVAPDRVRPDTGAMLD